MKQLQNRSSDTSPNNVSHKMGRCILRLQQYENLMKRMTANHAFSGYADEIEANRGIRNEKAGKKTLGQLVGDLTGSYLCTATANVENQDREDDTELDSSRAYFRMRFSLEIDEATYQRTKEGPAELAALRNELVHHFLERFDLQSESSVHDAELYLDEVYAVIDEQFRKLLGWAKSMDDTRKEAATFMNTQEYREYFMYGVFSGQEVHWPSTTIIQQLLVAERDCNENGWTSLARAITYIQPRWPDLTPKIYGCRSWRHVIHESKLFEILKRENPEGTGRLAWYRSKSDGTKER